MLFKIFPKLINPLRRIKLGKRLVLTLVFIFITTNVIVGLILYETSKDIVLSKTDQYLSDYIIQEKSNIDKFLGNQIKILDEVVTNVDLINTVRDYTPAFQKDQAAGMTTVLNEIFRASRSIPGFIGLEISNLTRMIASSQYRVTDGNIETSEIMKSTLQSPDRIKLFGTIPLEDPRIYMYEGEGIVIGVKIKNHTDGKLVGMAYLAFSETSLYDEIYKGVSAGNDEVYITDQDGVIISRNDKSFIGQIDNPQITDYIAQHEQTGNNQYQNFNIEINNTNYMVYCAVSDVTGWRIISLTNYDNLISEITSKFMTSLILFVVITSIVFLLAILITQSITIPLKSIIQAMRKTSIEGNYPEVTVTGNDEMSYLGDTFNQMSRRIKSLIAEINEIHKKEKQAEFKALQSQINPHFLYNTLDSVNWLAYLSGNLDICEIVNSLSVFFRLSLNKGKDFYTIEDEVEHVKSYINILKIKHRDQITFLIDVEEGCMKFRTVKILLQPLVENAVYHGIEPLGGKGEVYIHVFRKEDIIKMEVIDNGIGIDEISLGDIENSSDANNDNKGYGMGNINERIKLFFGNSYGMSVEKNQPRGTKITLAIPVIETTN